MSKIFWFSFLFSWKLQTAYEKILKFYTIFVVRATQKLRQVALKQSQ